MLSDLSTPQLKFDSMYDRKKAGAAAFSSDEESEGEMTDPDELDRLIPGGAGPSKKVRRVVLV